MPVIGATLLDCYTDSALLEWGYANGALSYTVTAQAAGGFTSSCSTNHTNCEIDLQCGQTYDFTMVASDGQCDSFQSDSVQMPSGKGSAPVCFSKWHLENFTSSSAR